jgi:hypothetical protein
MIDIVFVLALIAIVRILPLNKTKYKDNNIMYAQN